MINLTRMAQQVLHALLQWSTNNSSAWIVLPWLDVRLFCATHGSRMLPVD